MARNSSHAKKKVSSDPSYRKKKPLDYFPVARKTDIGFESGLPAGTIGYGDAGSVLSRLNNRLYRYGKLYDLKLDLSTAAAPGVVFEVWALSNTWYVQKAFEEAKMAFDMAYEDEKAFVNETNVGRWRDFRIRPSTGESYNPVTGFWAYPRSGITPGTATNLTGGQFVDSLVQVSGGATKQFSWAPTSSGTLFSLIEEYDLAGNQTRSPNLSTGDMPYEGLKADTSQIEAAALQTQGQDPPYNATTFPAVWVKVGELSVGSSGAQRLSTGYFHAPCGVFAVKTVGGTGNIGTDAGDNICLEIKAGKYKGVSAVNMERM